MRNTLVKLNTLWHKRIYERRRDIWLKTSGHRENLKSFFMYHDRHAERLFESDQMRGCDWRRFADALLVMSPETYHDHSILYNHAIRRAHARELGYVPRVIIHEWTPRIIRPFMRLHYRVNTYDDCGRLTDRCTVDINRWNNGRILSRVRSDIESELGYRACLHEENVWERAMRRDKVDGGDKGVSNSDTPK